MAKPQGWGSLNGSNSNGVGLIHITNSNAIDIRSIFSPSRTWLHFIIMVLISIGIHALCFSLGLNLIGNTYMQITPGYTNNSALNILTPTAVVGVGLWLVGIVLAPLSIGITLLSLRSMMIINGYYTNTWIRYIGTIISLCITGGIIYFLSYCWNDLIQMKETFNINYPDSLKQFLGGCGFATYVPLCIMSILITYNFFRPSSNIIAKMDPLLNDNTNKPYQGHTFRLLAPGLIGLLFVFTGVIGGTCVLCCIWNFHAAGYFYSQSPYSIIFDPNTQWVLGPIPNDPNYLQPYMYIKLYEDVLVYFSVVLGIIITGFLALRFPSLRRILHTRMGHYLGKFGRNAIIEHGKHVHSNKWSTKTIHFMNEIIAYIAELCLGEIIVVSAITGLACYWFWFWSTGYNRISNEVYSYNDNYPNLHIYARVLGHMTTFFMSFLTFPVTRNSVWESAFGIPFDRAIKHHRVLGRLCWVTVTVHMLMWQVKWLMEGTLWQNVINVEKLEVTPCENAPPYTCAPAGDCCANSAHYDNFTIPIVEFAWLLLTIVLIIATFGRRWNYELFHYTHHATLLFYLAALIHAWTNWYYTAVGLILYAFDKITRTIKATRPVEVISLTHAAGITRLIVRSSVLGSTGRHFAGQYCFINIPMIDQFQWHPFTISSGPSHNANGTLTFHIKDMGPKTWTHSLAELALAIQQNNLDNNNKHDEHATIQNLPVSIDGAYGNAGHYYEKDTIIMFAGGIGITPFHSIIQDLHTRALDSIANETHLGNIRKIHLIWVVRDLSIVHVFANTFMEILSANPGKLFSISIYCTYGSRKSKEPQSPTAIDDNDENETSTALLNGSVNRDNDNNDQDYSIPTPLDMHWLTPDIAAGVNTMVKYGRPNLPQIMKDITNDTRQYLQNNHQNNNNNNNKSSIDSEGDSDYKNLSPYVTTMVCGPHTMNADISALALEYSTDFHSEVFHF